MSKERRHEICSKGGKAAHAKGTGHEWNSETARAAGRKGGLANHRRRQERMAAAERAAQTTSTSDEQVTTNDPRPGVES